MDPAGEELRAKGKQREAGYWFVLLTLLLDILGIGLIIPVLPKLVVSLSGRTESDSAIVYGVFVAVYSANQFLFAPLLGALSDQYGRRPVLILSNLGTALDYVLMFFAPTLWLLFVGRIINGVTAANVTACNAYIADVTPPEQRAGRFGMVGAVFGIGFVFGPAIGGILGEHHPRLPFAFAAALAFVNVGYGWFVLPESLAVENREPFRWNKANPFGTLKALKKFDGLLPLAAVMTLVFLPMMGLRSVWVLFTGYKFGWGPKAVGFSLMAVGILSGSVQGGLTGKVVQRIGERKTLFAGIALSVVAYIGYGLATRGWQMYGFMVFGAAAGISGPAIQAMIANRAGPKNQGLAQGAFSSLQGLTAVVAPIVATSLFGWFSGKTAVAEIPGMPFFASALLAVVGLTVALSVVRDQVGAGVESKVPEQAAARAMDGKELAATPDMAVPPK